MGRINYIKKKKHSLKNTCDKEPAKNLPYLSSCYYFEYILSVDCDLDRVCIHDAKGKQKFSHLLCSHLDMNRVLKGKQILWISEIHPLHPKTHKPAGWRDAGGEWMWRVVMLGFDPHKCTVQGSWASSRDL